MSKDSTAPTVVSTVVIEDGAAKRYTVADRIREANSMRRNSMLPEFVGNIVEAANSLTRSTRNLCYIVEQGTEDLQEISSLMMEAQKRRLLENLAEA